MGKATGKPHLAIVPSPDPIVLDKQPLHPAAPVLTIEMFDVLLRTPMQTGTQRAFTVYPDVQQHINDTAGRGYNRAVLRSRVEDYKQEMLNGNWRLDGNPQQYDWNQRRINGQHRGLACIEAGKPYACYFSFGHDPDDYKTMDQLAVRRGRDLFHQAGWAYPNLCAHLATWLCRYKDGEFTSRETIKPEHLLARATLFGREQIEAAAKMGSAVQRTSKLASQYLGFVYFLAHEVEPDGADAFFSAWAKGGTLELPVQRKVTNLIAGVKKDTGKSCLDNRQLAIIINGWNTYAAGGKSSSPRLDWKPGDEFPTVSGWQKSKPVVRKAAAKKKR